MSSLCGDYLHLLIPLLTLKPPPHTDSIKPLLPSGKHLQHMDSFRLSPSAITYQPSAINRLPSPISHPHLPPAHLPTPQPQSALPESAICSDNEPPSFWTLHHISSPQPHVRVQLIRSDICKSPHHSYSSSLSLVQYIHTYTYITTDPGPKRATSCRCPSSPPPIEDSFVSCFKSGSMRS